MDDLDTRLTRLFQEAVDEIQPTDRLEEIRERTEGTSSRRGWWVAGGTALATAAAATAIALGQTDQAVDPEPLPADTPSQTPSPTPEPTPSQAASESPSDGPSASPEQKPSADASDEPGPGPTSGTSEPEAPVESVAIPVYFPGPGPDGLRLFREWHGAETSDRVATAALLAVARAPQDPDYEQLWPSGTDATAEWDGDVITVDISTDGVDEDLHGGWDGLEPETAELMVQQLIYTVQAAVGEGRVPVRLLLDGSHTDQVLGTPASEELTNAPVLDTLNHVSLSSPEEGAVVDEGSLEVSGAANSFEANVLYQLQRLEGTEIVTQGNFTAEGWAGDKLFPFQGTIDVSDVEPGTYQLIVSTDDASGGAEGPGAHTDTRTVVIE